MASLIFIPVRLILLLAIVVIAPISAAEEDAHDDNGGNLVLTPQQRQDNGIAVAKAERRSMSAQQTAPGEVVLNAYSSSKVTPRIASHVLARHAFIGEMVTKGQPLARLSSVEMAEAQGDLIIAVNEWRRVEKIGKEVVSGRRYTEAQVAMQQARARAQAYGMTQSQVRDLLAANDASQATGAYDLLSPQDGVVVSDNFLIGERIEPGQVLFELTDESTLWIEARLAAGKALDITLETPVQFSKDGTRWRDGRVVQIHHSLDELTRTRIIRVEVDNHDDSLHPGEFVRVEFLTGPGEVVLAVPVSSVVVMDGASLVFKLTHGDEIMAQPVEVGTRSGNWVQVSGELAAGDEIVVEGAFGLKSEFLKSERGAGHSH
jgi:cobalt-zinc-cadmium efflux system membrane fusion protein